MSNGIRQILMLLIPSAAIMAVLAMPITRLVYQRGAFGTAATHLVSQAMWVWALSLPAQRRQPAVLAHLLQPPAAVAQHRRSRWANLVVNVGFAPRSTGRSGSRAWCSGRWSARS